MLMLYNGNNKHFTKLIGKLVDQTIKQSTSIKYFIYLFINYYANFCFGTLKSIPVFVLFSIIYIQVFVYVKKKILAVNFSSG